MQTKQFIGTGVAIITPFNEDRSVDYPTLESHVEMLIQNGIDYLVVLGTTGESVTLSAEEQKKVIQCVIEKNNKRLPIVVGIGGNNTAAIVQKINETNFVGIDAILSVAPYYNKPTQDGLYQHFKMIAEASPVPIILYNVPARTGSNILPPTVAKLAHDFENIIAIKEATGSFEQAMEIIKNKPENFLVISGEDGITLPLISIGFSGVISVIGNAFPKEFSDMVRLSLDMRYSEAQKIHYSFTEIIRLLFVDGNPAGVKAVLHIKNLCKNVVREPLVPVTEQTYTRLMELVR